MVQRLSPRFLLGAIAVLVLLILGIVFASDQVVQAWRVTHLTATVVPSDLPLVPLPSSTTLPRVKPPAAPEPSVPVIAESSSTVSLMFVGDIMLDRNVKIRSLNAGSRAYPFRLLPSDWFNQADYAIANLEGPVTPVRRAPEKSIDFQFDPDVISALQATGIDAFSQANNHGLDQGQAGYTDSVSALRGAGFLVFGHQVQDGMISYATTTIKGVRFAFMGWNTTDNPMDRADAAKAIAQAKTEADVVIAFMHWGLEYHDHPSADQIDTAHWLIDHGVSAVIGGHPHWVQGVTTYKQAPIFWSLGNFVFDQDFSSETRESLAIKIFIKGTVIESAELIPLQITASQPHVLEGEARQKRLDKLANISDDKDATWSQAVASGTVRF